MNRPVTLPPPETRTAVAGGPFASLPPRDRIIVALDVSTAGEARKLVSTLADVVSTFKIGKQLFTAEGPAIVRELVGAGHGVFLDLKFHDIPTTVGAAVRSAASLGVKMLTVHAAGGSAMLRAAADAAAQSVARPTVLAVTVLTSFQENDLRETGVSGRVVDQALRLGALALGNGCGGLVSSPREAAELRRELGAGFALITPGIRPAGSEAGDQARAATPTAAIQAGVTHLVVGRPITAAADPSGAATQILEELRAAIANRG
ncbi:MAG TPA: orotidine-5'-phosphate decarboxylase [Terriglobales bacterium]|nr:orotidine-5'-phosphate decarboxylase [Terriglobales bacterium]